MKLTSQPLEVQTKHVFGISRSASQTFHNALVSLEHDGREGIGEAAPSDFYGEDQGSTLRALETIASALNKAGQSAFHLQSLLEIAEAAEAPCAAAKAAYDMALFDLLGKELYAPLWRILGLDPNRTPVTSFTIGLDDLDVMLEKVLEASHFPLLKVKLKAGADVDVIKAIRSKTSQRIRVDANCSWEPEAAVGIIKQLESLGVEMVEQPVEREDIEGLKYVADRVDVPVFADESVMTSADIPRVAGAADGINIKLMKCGGIAEALRMIHTARAHGLKVMIGCMIESSLAVTAAAHLTPLVDAADLDGNLLLREDPFEGVRVDSGKLILPTEPGLGVRRRRAAVDELA